jgi:hypothetical protein
MSTNATSLHRGGATGPLTAAAAPRPRTAHTPTRLGHLLLHRLAHHGELAHRGDR